MNGIIWDKLLITNFITDIDLYVTYEKKQWYEIVNIGRIWYEMGIPYHTYIRLFIYKPRIEGWSWGDPFYNQSTYI